MLKLIVLAFALSITGLAVFTLRPSGDIPPIVLPHEIGPTLKQIQPYRTWTKVTREPILVNYFFETAG